MWKKFIYLYSRATYQRTPLASLLLIFASVFRIDVTNLLAASNGSSESSQCRVSMSQLATSRLTLELEREKERELDLQRLGVISTISEEHRPHDLIHHRAGCHANGHVPSGGMRLIQSEVRAAQQRELELR